MKASGLALKAKKQYSTWDHSNWHCYYHALSGDELKTQIISIFYKPTEDERSWSFSDVSSAYKMNEEQGLKDWIVGKYGEMPESDLNECVGYIIQFLNDAKIEYTGRPFIQ